MKSRNTTINQSSPRKNAVDKRIQSLGTDQNIAHVYKKTGHLSQLQIHYI